MPHFIYILHSARGHYYTGYTTDLKRRLTEHQSGKGAKFTRAFGAKDILYFEEFSDKSKALKREYEIKQLTRSEKTRLIKNFKKKP